ncbi:MAG: sulfatase/phosphatase domain-containing protein, partial [Bacteroidota bacterium]
SFYYEHTINQFKTIPVSMGFRSQRYKYLIYPESENQFEELYDLKNDKEEINNLAISHKKKELLCRMREKFKKANNGNGTVFI